MDSTLFCSIIIPTYNRNDLLEKCLSTLEFSVQGVSNYEIIVTDDSQTCEAQKLINEKFKWIKWLEGPHKGPAANRNNGAKQANGKWLVFLDDDCIPDKDLIKNYRQAIIENSDILAFEGCIKADRPKRHFLEESPVNETGGYFWSCNIMVQKEYFFDNLNGFDENFPYAAMEDVDLRERIKKGNQPILFVKNAFVIHPWRLQRDAMKDAKERFISYKYLCSKHPHLKKKITIATKIKNELRFYLKRVLFKIIPYRGRGMSRYIQVHLYDNFLNKKYL